ncbi:RING-H2_zinc_finger/Anaphase-promoting_complex_subunit_11_RING-H2_finger/Ring_finger_domain_containing_protein (plasmid) [Leishmania braziliensis MHOM/BR/75/M2904]|uniref:RING-H2 zinc finger/Anaphase-promoting complex subunit 11 RING-H2 finger/Ring finger domain containing protein n=1 Tax=Leishmania braziliensis MHOM/BR/75/M2904 TaxID=420245 RepID=A0A3P3Z293_LEIBR|nr:unnamed protein product [Leishmania braziliensis]SYZ64348.1 RING-H2_zinc_finger/Anaphase-promoting_complex_subunit_11_RING-H2_finger/Ring_finger_domain_containing_protein [Leishmania braziliensis MHOM/BR/75/M2904]
MSASTPAMTASSTTPEPSNPSVAKPISSGGDAGTVVTSRIPCRITAQQWDTVAVWSWDVQTRACAICKNNLADHCINCLAKAPPSSTSAAAATTLSYTASIVPESSAGRSIGRASAAQTPPPPTTIAKHSTLAIPADLSDRCCVAWGACGHVYHYHCISRWIQMRSMCPVCGRQWQLHKISSNE